MTSLYTCRKCRTVFSVSALDSNAHLLKKSMRCPRAKPCDGRIFHSATTNIPPDFAVVSVDALELYQATMGMGLPKERKCTPAVLEKVLVGAKIKSVHVEAVPATSRSLIFSITLDNGKVVHLAASTKGAAVYRITEEANGR